MERQPLNMPLPLKNQIQKKAVNPHFQLSKDNIKIIDALEHFNKTGIVKEDLLPGFDITGHWVGIWNCPYINEDQYTKEISKHKIKKEQTTKKDRSGNIHLLTSLAYIPKELGSEPHNSNPKSGIHIEYTSIAGVLDLPKTKYIHAPNLTHVGGKISLPQCKNCYMPKLKSVKGFFALGSTSEVELPALEEVQGLLDIYNSKTAKLPKLKSVEMIKFENCPVKIKSKIISKLSTKSLESFKEKIYDLGTLEIINSQIKERLLGEKIKTINNETFIEI